MNDTLLVYVIQGICNIFQDTAGFIQGERRLANTRTQCPTLHKRHDNVVPGFVVCQVLTRIVDRHEMFVMKRGHEARFSDKAAQHVLVFAFKDFDSHSTIKMSIVPLIDIGHPPSSNQLIQLITAESFPLQSWHTSSPDVRYRAVSCYMTGHFGLISIPARRYRAPAW